MHLSQRSLQLKRYLPFLMLQRVILSLMEVMTQRRLPMISIFDNHTSDSAMISLDQDWIFKIRK